MSTGDSTDESPKALVVSPPSPRSECDPRPSRAAPFAASAATPVPAPLPPGPMGASHTEHSRRSEAVKRIEEARASRAQRLLLLPPQMMQRPHVPRTAWVKKEEEPSEDERSVSTPVRAATPSAKV